MRLALVDLQQQLTFSWVEIDIDRDKDLIRQFDEFVPVLYYQGTKVCHYFLDEQTLRDLINR